MATAMEVVAESPRQLTSSLQPLVAGVLVAWLPPITGRRPSAVSATTAVAAVIATFAVLEPVSIFAPPAFSRASTHPFPSSSASFHFE